MGYGFERSETVGAGSIRILDEETEAGLLELKRAGNREAGAVHEYRKHLKKARSLVRMARCVLPEQTGKQKTRRLADAARVLAPWRDREALLEAVNRIIEADAEPSLTPHVHLLHNRLVEQIKLTQEDEAALNHALSTAEGLLTEFRAEYRHWQFDTESKAKLCKAFRRVVRDGRAALKEAKKHPNPEVMHEWRKTGKHLRHYVMLVEQAWPAYFKTLESELHQFTDTLGEGHDLALLKDYVGRRMCGDGQQPDWLALESLVAGQIVSKNRGALNAGARLFVEPPRAFYRRTKCYVALWEGKA